MPILSQLEKHAIHTVVATPVTVDAGGNETPGTPINLTKCYIRMKQGRIIDNVTGAEIATRGYILSLENNNLDMNYRFTLPSPAFKDPRTLLVPADVQPRSDRNSARLFERIDLIA